MFNFRAFLDEYGIEYYEGDYPHKHCRPGWINMECPRCTGNPGLHLGVSENSGQFVCWRCGFIPLLEAIRKFTGCNWNQARQIARQFGATKQYKRYRKEPKEKDIDVEFPKGTLDYFPKTHRKYLENRNFDPDYLIDTWNLRATGNLGKYKNRIIVPIYYKNRLMSYQGRDITGKAEAKYMACEQENERRHHKYCLYGLDVVASESVIVVEGVTDVWRLGPGAVATFGIKYTETQLLLLYYNFKRIFILFDVTDPESSEQGKKLAAHLSVLGKEAEVVKYDQDKDPGDLSDNQANYLMRDLLIK